MDTKAFRLRMTAPLHVGEMGVGLEETHAYIPSDTLFSALAVTWLEMGEHQAVVKRLATEFATEPPLLLTSAFPFVGKVLLWPKPHLPIQPTSSKDNELSEGDGQKSNSGKLYKRVQWVSTKILQKLIAGISDAAFEQLWEKRELIQGGAVWLDQSELADAEIKASGDEAKAFRIWSTGNVPKVTIDRIRNASTLFHVGRVHFAPNCGLWLQAQGESSWLERTEGALELLADSGIGGQRSRGNGQFRLERITDFEPPDLPKQSTNILVLSRLAPTQAQMDLLKDKDASYQLVTVGGYNGTPGYNPLIRKQVRLLTEGSIIGQSPTAPGQLVDVTPDKAPPNQKMYRYGFGFTLPVQICPTSEGANHATKAHL